MLILALLVSVAPAKSVFAASKIKNSQTFQVKSGGKGKIKVTGLTDGLNYVDIQISTSKKFAKGKTETYKACTKKFQKSKKYTNEDQIEYNMIFKKLKSGKTYYVRIRAVDILNADTGERGQVSKWSKAKKIKVK